MSYPYQTKIAEINKTVADPIVRIVGISEVMLNYLEKKTNKDLDDFKLNAGYNNYTLFWRDVYPAFQALAWCVCFVVWVCRQAGIGSDIVPSVWSCTVMRDWAKPKGLWYAKSATPMAGDFVIYQDSSGKPCHIGLVVKVDNNNIYTIEGNTSTGSGFEANGGGTARKTWARNSTRIHGYVRPNYPKPTQPKEELTMGQFEELTKLIKDQTVIIANQGTMIDELTTRVEAIAGQVMSRWDSLEDIPEWGRPTIQKLVDAKIMIGVNEPRHKTMDAAGQEVAYGDLNLTYEMLRMMVVNDRSGWYDSLS